MAANEKPCASDQVGEEIVKSVLGPEQGGSWTGSGPRCDNHILPRHIGYLVIVQLLHLGLTFCQDSRISCHTDNSNFLDLVLMTMSSSAVSCSAVKIQPLHPLQGNHLALKQKYKNSYTNISGGFAHFPT